MRRINPESEILAEIVGETDFRGRFFPGLFAIKMYRNRVEVGLFLVIIAIEWNKSGRKFYSHRVYKKITIQKRTE